MDCSPIKEYALDAILTPLDIEEFESRYFRRAPLHVPGYPEKFDFAMNWEILTGIVNQSAIWSPRSLQLYLDNAPVPADQYCNPGITRDGNDGLLVDLERVQDWIGMGASMVLNDIETLTPGMLNIAKALGTNPGGKVQGNLYCSRQARQAFPVHFDTHDVFALQITGEKQWRVYQRHFKDPINHPEFKLLDQSYHEQHKGPLTAEFVMRPGDLAYIPRGFYHEALAESDSTVHLSFSVVPPIGLDLISAVFERAVFDEVFRQAIPNPLIDGGRATEQHLTRLAGRFRELVREREFQDRFVENLNGFGFKRSQFTLPDDTHPGNRRDDAGQISFPALISSSDNSTPD